VNIKKASGYLEIMFPAALIRNSGPFTGSRRPTVPMIKEFSGISSSFLRFCF